MTRADGAQFFGPITGSQIAIGNREVVQKQNQYAATAAPDAAGQQLAATLTALLATVDVLRLSAAQATALREDAQAVLAEVASEEPDEGRLRRMVARVRNVLATVTAGAVTGAATGAGTGGAQWAQSLLDDLQRALP
ncbi:hypothetical protein ACFWPU_11170 [Streptomyces sp. NPDC058471]|uniref:hypothetical protein n=1 Tax=Streptomyces sp. NPDC058471 TaxID=3346516 RepID=UPI00364A32EA